jgi:hypothetical protein
MAEPAVLTERALNRALLARQMLLARAAPMSVSAATERLAGLQTQAPNPPYVGLWTRVEGFERTALERALAQRRVVRLALMRSTLHLVSARDALAWRPLLAVVGQRGLQASRGKLLQGLDRDEVAAHAAALLAARPLSAAQLGHALAERWPGREAEALAALARVHLPLAQLPPAGRWNEFRSAPLGVLTDWLRRPLAESASVDALIIRYLAAFGPASAKDAQVWSGLTGLAAVFERLRPQLKRLRDEAGHELFDLPRAPRPAPDTPAPIRFLPEWDNLLLSHADRGRVMAAAHKPGVFSVNGIIRATVLLDGFVHATWTVDASATRAVLRVQPLAAGFSRAQQRELVDEGRRLLAFISPGTPAEVRLARD